MDPKSSETQVRKIACGLGILQGLAYGIISLICVILYNTATPSITSDSYMATISTYMYALFLGVNFATFDGQTFTPRTFTVFAWIHLALNISWIISSIQTYLGKGFSPEKNVRSWSIITAAVCFWDLLTVIIIGSDYDKCLGFFEKYTSYPLLTAYQNVCANGLLIPMVIAAKGFVLWIINAIFAVLLFRMSRQTIKGHVQNFQNTPSTIQREYATNMGQGQYPANPQQGQYPVNAQQGQYPAQQEQYPAYYSGPAPAYSSSTHLNSDNRVPIPEPDYDRPSTHPLNRI